MNNKVTKNYVYSAIYQIIAVIVPLLTTPYVSRVLKADQIGVYGFTTAVATYFLMFGNLGIMYYGQLKLASVRDDKEKLSKVFWELFITRTIVLFISTIIYIAYIFLTDIYRNEYLILLTVLFSGFLDISWLFQALEMFKITVLRNSFIKISALVLVYICVKSEDDLILYMLIVYGSTILGNLTLWPYLKKYIKFEIRRPINFKIHFYMCLVYFIPILAGSAYTYLDKVLIKLLTGLNSEVGYYEQAHKIEQVLVCFVTAIGTVLLPRLKYIRENGDQIEVLNIINKSIRIVFLFGLPMVCGVFLISDELIPWFLGEGYDKCIILLKIFSILLFLTGLNSLIGSQCLMSSGRQKEYNIGIVVAAVVNIILNFMLIPRYLSVGAAVSTVIGELTVFLIFLKYSSKELNIIKIVLDSKKVFISVCVMIISIELISFFNIQNYILCILSKVLVGVFSYFICLFVLKEEIIIDFYKNLLKKKEAK